MSILMSFPIGSFFAAKSQPRPSPEPISINASSALIEAIATGYCILAQVRVFWNRVLLTIAAADLPLMEMLAGVSPQSCVSVLVFLQLCCITTFLAFLLSRLHLFSSTKIEILGNT